MHQGAKNQFERAVDEFVRWRAVPEAERSPAPAWWWGPAFEIRGVQQAMPAEWCSSLELPDGSSYADGRRGIPQLLRRSDVIAVARRFSAPAGHSNPA